MQLHYDRIETLVDIGAVLSYLRDLALEAGVARMSYYVTPQFENATPVATGVFSYGYDEEWLALCDAEGLHHCDPIPDRVMEFGALMTWQDAMGWKHNTPEQERCFERMREFGLIHGFGLPLYGRNGRDAYAAFDFLRHVDDVDPQAVGLVRTLAQAAHQRISILVEYKYGGPTLSEREAEVLAWAARGKSNNSIATILDISPDTVKTYSKRIYAKLEVTDRVGAVVKALKLGLVKI
jgi:DNA-binding CsgD family transcriptional regulator